MTRTRHRFRLAAGWLCLFATSVAAHAAAPSSAIAFDQLADRLDNSELAPASVAEDKQVLAHLRGLLPPGDVQRELRYRWLYCAFGFDNDMRGGYAYATRGLADAQRAGDTLAQANFALCRGSYRQALNDTRGALADFGSAIDLARKQENPQLLGDALSSRGDMESFLGDQARALTDFLQAQHLYESVHHPRAAEANLLSIATAFRRMGEYTQARAWFGRAQAAAQREGDVTGQFAVDLQLGFLQLVQDKPGDALVLDRQGLALAEQMGDRQSTGSARLALADALNASKRYVEALDSLRQAGADFAAAGDRSSDGMLALDTGVAYAGLGRYPRAIDALRAAEGKLSGSDNPRYQELLYATRASVYESMHEPEAALADLKRSMALRQAQQREAHSQYGLWVSYQFDAERRDLEDRRLRAEAALKEQRVQSLERVRDWQGISLLFGSLLVLLLLWLALRQYRSSRRLRSMALTDALTGVANRRGIEHALGAVVAQAHSEHRDLSVLAIDVDHFKAINDGHGHQTGDEVLRRLARACQHALRRDDRLGRTGGEEFLVVLPDTPLAAALQIAERLRASIAILDLRELGAGVAITVSLGVAELRGDETAEHLVLRADAALYQAKREGRDCVRLASGDAASATRASPENRRPALSVVRD